MTWEQCGLRSNRAVSRIAATFVAIAPLNCAVAQDVPASAKGEITRFGDWELICDAPAAASAPDARPCKIAQRLVVKDSGQSVFAMTIVQAGQKNRLVAIISTPLGGYLAPGMLLTIDRGRSFKVLFETCNTAGCHGGFEFAGRIAQTLQKGKALKVKLWAGKDKPTDVTVSLAGFDEAVAKLKPAKT